MGGKQRLFTGPAGRTGTGGCWPLLTGERRHYELAAGRDSRPYIETIERFVHGGGMLPEQVWYGPEVEHFKPGDATGSAMPLCWAHAEYMALVRSTADGKIFDRIPPVYDRYVRNRLLTEELSHEMWTAAHRIKTIRRGQTARVLLAGEAVVRCTNGGGNEETKELHAMDSGLGCWFVDLPAPVVAGGFIEFFIDSKEHGDSGERHRIEVIGRE